MNPIINNLLLVFVCLIIKNFLNLSTQKFNVIFTKFNQTKKNQIMKKLMLLLIPILFLLASCETVPEDSATTSPDGNNDPGREETNIAGVFEMNSGPHDLAIKGSFVYACRDDKIYVIDISKVANPTLVNTIDDLERNNIFECLCVEGNTLYAGCTSSSGVYAYDISDPANPKQAGKYITEIYSGNKMKVLSLYYGGGFLWAGGSNGQSGLIAKFNVSDNANIKLEEYNVLSGIGNGIEGIWANSSNAFISTANGHILSYNASNITSGNIGDYTFEAEAGHSHWGRTIVGYGTKLYWADWGAGLITLDISNPTDIKAAALITNSSYKAQEPDAEGTDVYDIALDSDAGKIYVANGWSGLLQIDVNYSDRVESYFDYKDNNYYCIKLSGNYVIVGDIAAGTTDVMGLKIIKVK